MDEDDRKLLTEREDTADEGTGEEAAAETAGNLCKFDLL